MKTDNDHDDDLVTGGVILDVHKESISPPDSGLSDPKGRSGKDDEKDDVTTDQMVRDVKIKGIGDDVCHHETNGVIMPSVAASCETSDAYRYIDREDGTSCESFKIEVHNVPRYTTYTAVKKLFANKFSLKVQKVKLIGNPIKFAFIAFTSEEDRSKALDHLSGFVWKGCKVSASVAAPKADPLTVKRAMDGNQNADKNEKKEKRMRTSDEKGDTDDEDSQSLSDKLNDQVASLWRLSYPQQLQEKTKIINDFLIDLHKDIGRMIQHSQTEAAIDGGQESKEKLFQWFIFGKRHCDRKPCVPDAIEASPVIDGYRNKCEFSIDVDRTVGFRLGCYKDGSVRVAGVADCPIVSPVMKKIVLVVESFMKEKTKLLPFNPVNNEGHWKQVLVRLNSNEDSCLISLSLDSKGVSEEVIQKEVQAMNESIAVDVENVSLFLEVVGKRGRENQRLRLIRGPAALTEKMVISGKELTFQISADAFFQINTSAAQCCYEKIAERLNLRKETLLLDVCCGTGAIGISLSHAVAHVIGIEIVNEAVRDAEKNAVANNITNIEFRSGRAEDVVPKIMAMPEIASKYTDIVAIIDPPRAGLNQSVIKALRSAEKVSRIIYVSCDPRFAKQNLIDLCRPISKSYRGKPFIPVSATPIDMFPHTNRYELIFAYERLTSAVQFDRTDVTSAATVGQENAAN